MSRLLSNFALADAFHRAVYDSGYKIVTIRIPNYISHIKVSEHQRPKYWHLTDKGIPQKVLDLLSTAQLKVGKNGILTDIYGQPIVRNRKNVGKEKMQIINGQHLYNGQVHYTVRAKMVDAMKSYFHQKIKEELDKHYIDFKVVGMGIDVYRPEMPGQSTWDLDNFIWIYHKTIQDVLVDLRLVQSDDVDHIDFIGPYFYGESKEPIMDIHLYTLDLTRNQ